MRGLAGKRILITGGASGIGAATAARFLDEGSQVVVLPQETQEASPRRVRGVNVPPAAYCEPGEWAGEGNKNHWVQRVEGKNAVFAAYSVG